MAKHARLPADQPLWLAISEDEFVTVQKLRQQWDPVVKNSPPMQVEVIDLPGIPSDARPWNVIDMKQQEMSHWYPAKRHIPLYIRQYDVLLNELSDLSMQVPFPNKAFLEKVVLLYWTGIHAHFFLRINKSVLMSMTNYFLMRYYFAPGGIFHGDLDIIALFLPREAFHAYFVKHALSTYQKEPQDLGVQWR